MLTPYILLTCFFSSTADNTKLVTLPVYLGPQLMPPQLAPRTARPQSCCQTPCCPTIPGIGFTNQKMPVLYKFRPLKLSVNLGPTGKSLVHLYLYYFYCFIFTLTVLCTTVYELYCIVVLVTVILCFSLYGYSATLATKLIIKLDLTWLDHVTTRLHRSPKPATIICKHIILYRIIL